VRFTQVRADLLDASRILEEAALDKYVFQRDAYFQRRRSLVYDGRPPREDVR
jgi:phospholipid-binding lipoprotein MlaA